MKKYCLKSIFNDKQPKFLFLTEYVQLKMILKKINEEYIIGKPKKMIYRN